MPPAAGATGVSEPNRPCVSWSRPAVKYTELASPPLPPLPTCSAHSPSIWIGLPSGSFRLPRDLPVVGLKTLMRPLPKLPTSRSPLEGPEARRRDRQAPRRVERAARDQALLPAGQARRPVQVEHVDEAVALAGHVVVLVGVLLGVGDIDLAAQDLHVERGEALGEVRVGERTRLQRDGLEVGVVDLDLAGAEVGGVEHRRRVGVGREDRRAGVALLAMVRPL